MNRIAKAAITSAMVFIIALAFEITLGLDEVRPAKTSTAFRIEVVDVSSKTAALQILDAEAREFSASIIKIQPDSRSSLSGRILYMFGTPPESVYPEGKYPTFSPQSLTTRIRPGFEITTEDLRGTYATTLDKNALQRLVDSLNSQGLTATVHNVPTLSIVLTSIGQANFAGILLVVLFALLLSIFYAVSQQRKAFAIRSIHGFSPSSNIGITVASISKTFGLALTATILAGLPILYLYNEFNQAVRFLSVSVVAILGLYLVISLLGVAAVLILDRGNIPEIIKGERTVGRIGVLGAIIQVLIVAITIGTASATINRIDSLEESIAKNSEWTTSGPLYALRLSTTSQHTELVAGADGLATAIDELEQANSVLLAHHNDTAEGSQRSDFAPEGSRSMMVNSEYLRRQPVEDLDGNILHLPPPDKDTFVLLVPESFTGDQKALVQEWEEGFARWCALGRSPGFTCNPRGEILIIRSDQSFSTYGNTKYMPLELQGPTELKDPVVAVLSFRSGLLSPVKITDYISNDDVLFSDPAALDDALTNAGIRQNFQGIDNAADAVATATAISRHELRMDVISLTLGLATLVAALIVLVSVYCDRQLRPLFIKLIHGYRFFSRHWRYLLSSAGLTFLGLVIAQVAGQSLVTMEAKLLALTLLGAQLVISIGATRIVETRFRADYIKRS